MEKVGAMGDPGPRSTALLVLTGILIGCLCIMASPTQADPAPSGFDPTSGIHIDGVLVADDGSLVLAGTAASGWAVYSEETGKTSTAGGRWTAPIPAGETPMVTLTVIGPEGTGTEVVIDLRGEVEYVASRS